MSLRNDWGYSCATTVAAVAALGQAPLAYFTDAASPGLRTGAAVVLLLAFVAFTVRVVRTLRHARKAPNGGYVASGVRWGLLLGSAWSALNAGLIVHSWFEFTGGHMPPGVGVLDSGIMKAAAAYAVLAIVCLGLAALCRLLGGAAQPLGWSAAATAMSLALVIVSEASVQALFGSTGLEWPPSVVAAVALLAIVAGIVTRGRWADAQATIAGAALCIAAVMCVMSAAEALFDLWARHGSRNEMIMLLLIAVVYAAAGSGLTHEESRERQSPA